MNTKNMCVNSVLKHGGDILFSDSIQIEKEHIQHGETTVYEHAFNVACLSIYLAFMLSIKINEKEMVRGALLHDYFMYDWHTPSDTHRLHGFTHPKRALNNAKDNFKVGIIEENIIKRHMFPLTIVPPKYKESIIVCVADKLSTIAEMFNVGCLKF